MPNYNINPTSRSGQSIFGRVPGSLDMPPSVYDQLSELYPNLSEGGNTYLRNTASRQAGNLSPGTWESLQDRAAAFGLNAGQPGMSPLAISRLIGLTGNTSEALSQKGDEDWLRFLNVGNTLDNPALANEIATQNSVWNSAPDPTEAGNYAKSLFTEYLNSMKNPAVGGPRGPINVGSNRSGGSLFPGFTTTNDWLDTIGYGGAQRNPYTVWDNAAGYSAGDTNWGSNNSNPYMNSLNTLYHQPQNWDYSSYSSIPGNEYYGGFD